MAASVFLKVTFKATNFPRMMKSLHIITYVTGAQRKNKTKQKTD
jgi:hypothetical protein